MDMIEKIVREACARSPDGKISPLEFTNHASRAMRYSTFSPMEVSIIFHYAGKGEGKRLRLRDFAQLLDPKWGPPKAELKKPEAVSGSFLHEFGKVRWVARVGEEMLSDASPSLGSRRTTLDWEVSPGLVSRRWPSHCVLS